MIGWLEEKVKQIDVQSLLKQTSEYHHITLLQQAFLILAAAKKQPVLSIQENSYQSMKLGQLIQFLNPDLSVVILEHEESLRVEAIASSPENFRIKMKGFYQLVNDQVDVVITSIASFSRKIIEKSVFKEHQIQLNINDEIDLTTLEKKLLSIGYRRVSIVEQPGTFAKRGGVLDVYSIQYPQPLRVEFFDTMIEDLRFFSVETQKTIEKTASATLFVANDLLVNETQQREIRHKINQSLSHLALFPSEKEQVESSIELDLQQFFAGIVDGKFYRYFGLLDTQTTLIDYLDHPLILVNSLETTQKAHRFLHEETVEYLSQEVLEKRWVPLYDILYPFEKVDSSHPTYFHQLQSATTEINLDIHEMFNPQLELKQHLHQLHQQAQEAPVVLCVNKPEMETIKTTLQQEMIDYSLKVSSTQNGLYLCEYPLVCGFTFDQLKVYSSLELLGHQHRKTRFETQFRSAQALSGIAQLEIGDYVVHTNYGIGRYRGLKTSNINGYNKDFLDIEYAENQSLMVPLEQFKLVRKYLSSEGLKVRLNKLGSSSWSKTKERIRQNVDHIADELIELYQKRKQQQGFSFSEDSELQKQFEQEFPYELTLDQKQAIEEVKQDMESFNPMDRLLCGDVGFGKTEVAIRATFKAVVDHKQVVFLCPTTVLSQQHYQTFKKRFKNYPVEIKVLNRFVEPSNQKRILQEVKEHKIDILIGTHRVLSQDVQFSDLGLLIIDEEQRFGVAQKEKIKQLKHTIDVLSLSATPIPRTLQMSLIGIRSLSQLNTAPQNRLPVMTHVVEKNEQLITDLIDREMMRNGQVFYLYNNTSTIYSVAAKLQAKFPAYKVGVAHGKMSKEEIEDVMVEFNDNQIQILVCTTIVETGIDIPNANTMIIEKAERFGLAQLYQIKGRVGRSDRLAYAYLLVEPKKQLTEIASKRLEAIKEFTQLGSGYKIAMRDLTIRGAGEILGGNQSGFIDSVGIDLYIELLQEAIDVKQRKQVIKTKGPLHLEIDGYIPDEYVQNDALKIDLYQQIDHISTLSELRLFYQQIKDRFGQYDKSVALLLEKKQLELFLQQDIVDNFKDKPKTYELVFTQAFSDRVDGVYLFSLISEINQHITLKYLAKQIYLTCPKGKEAISELVEIIERLLKQHEN